MSTRYLIVISFIVSISACREKTEDKVFLILPHGKYSNWVYFNVKYLTFRSIEGQLLIDTTYTPESNNFVVHHSENIEEYPSIKHFLERPLAQFQIMEDEQERLNCDPILSVYVKYVDRQDSTLIQLRTTMPCGTIEKGLDAEIERLREKYAR